LYYKSRSWRQSVYCLVISGKKSIFFKKSFLRLIDLCLMWTWAIFQLYHGVNKPYVNHLEHHYKFFKRMKIILIVWHSVFTHFFVLKITNFILLKIVIHFMCHKILKFCFVTYTCLKMILTCAIIPLKNNPMVNTDSITLPFLKLTSHFHSTWHFETNFLSS
jgi:hypothetical protein